MRLPIVQLGQPVLWEQATEVAPADIAAPGFQQLLADMDETLRLEKGAGLAAPQVAQGVRVFLGAILPPLIPDGDPEIETFINPRLVGASEETVESWEGCLSFPELLVQVMRRKAVRVQYLNPRGETCLLDATGFAARVIQHEIDHLDGILTLDRATSSRHIIKASEAKAYFGTDDDEDEDADV